MLPSFGVLLGVGALLPPVGLSLVFLGFPDAPPVALLFMGPCIVIALATWAIARGRASGAVVLSLYGAAVTLLVAANSADLASPGAGSDAVSGFAWASALGSGLALAVGIGLAWPRSLAPRVAGWRRRLSATAPGWAGRHPGPLVAGAAATLVPLTALLAVAIGQVADPSCGPGRECVAEAGVSLILPAGWRSQPRDEADILFAAAPSHDSPYGLMIRRGADQFDPPVPADLDEVERSLVAALAPGGQMSFTQVNESIVDRVTLPLGPAIRARYSQTTSFFLSDNATIVSYWCFLDGRLLTIQYVENHGEGDAMLLPDVPPDVRSSLDSLRPLAADTSSLAGPWATLDAATEPSAQASSITTAAGTIALEGSTAYLLDGAFEVTDLDPTGAWLPRFLTGLGDGAAVFGSASDRAWPARYAVWTTAMVVRGPGPIRSCSAWASHSGR